MHAALIVIEQSRKTASSNPTMPGLLASNVMRRYPPGRP